MAEKRFGLPRQEKIRRGSDFDRVFREGRRISEPSVYARFLPNELAITRVGFAVPTRFGKAAKRNRARRLLREAYRLHKHEMPPGFDIVFLPGAGRHDPPLGVLERSMSGVARRLPRSERGEGTGRHRCD